MKIKKKISVDTPIKDPDKVKMTKSEKNKTPPTMKKSKTAERGLVNDSSMGTGQKKVNRKRKKLGKSETESPEMTVSVKRVKRNQNILVNDESVNVVQKDAKLKKKKHGKNEVSALMMEHVKQRALKKSELNNNDLSIESGQNKAKRKRKRNKRTGSETEPSEVTAKKEKLSAENDVSNDGEIVKKKKRKRARRGLKGGKNKSCSADDNTEIAKQQTDVPVVKKKRKNRRGKKKWEKEAEEKSNTSSPSAVAGKESRKRKQPDSLSGSPVKKGKMAASGQNLIKDGVKPTKDGVKPTKDDENPKKKKTRRERRGKKARTENTPTKDEDKVVSLKVSETTKLKGTSQSLNTVTKKTSMEKKQSQNKEQVANKDSDDENNNKKKKKKRKRKRKNSSSLDLSNVESNKHLEKLDNSNVNKVNNSMTQKASGKSVKLSEKLSATLDSARFRFINEQLYTKTGKEASDLFNNDKDAFKIYHQGYSSQISKWPVSPVEKIIKYIKKKNKSLVVCDFGCGEAKISQSVKNKVYSYDLIALNKHVTVSDMSKVPLADESIDIAVFCLSLMGTNLADYLVEANRVLKTGGILKIAEVASRFENCKNFIRALKRLGFSLLTKDLSNTHFYLFDFTKTGLAEKWNSLFGLELQPCLYKKR